MNPLDHIAPERGPDCLSDFALDRWLVGRASAEESARFAEHLGSCDRCAARYAGLKRDREAFASEPRLPPQAASRPQLSAAKRAPSNRRRWAATGIAAALAAAAAVVSTVSPEPAGPTGFRSKGARAIGFYVKHGEHVRRGAAGEVVAPGDALRFVYTSEDGGYFAVLSLDGSGRASAYYPSDEALRTVPIAAGRDVPLPISTVLDGTLGPELLFGVFCDRAVDLAPVLRALERDAHGAAPPGCELDRLAIEKREAEL